MGIHPWSPQLWTTRDPGATSRAVGQSRRQERDLQIRHFAASRDPLLTRDSAQTTGNADLQVVSSPLTDSSRRPLPYHERGEGVDSCGIRLNDPASGFSGSPCFVASRGVVRPWCDLQTSVLGVEPTAP